MMELRILSPSEEGFIKQIEWNNEELKQELAERMCQYHGLVLTDDQISGGRKELAKLRKLKEALESERKRIKSRCLEPYQKFEAQIREITALVDEPIILLDSQIKEYETQKRVEKTNQIHDLYDAQIGMLRGILPFDRILKKQWLNVSVSLKSIEKEIGELTERVNHDLDTMESLGSRFDSQIRDVYIRTLDLSVALQEKKRLEEQEQRLAERKAEREEEIAKQKEREVALEQARQEYLESRLPENAQVPAQNAAGMPAPSSYTVQGSESGALPDREERCPQDILYQVGLEVSGSREQLIAFQNWLIEQKISYKVTAKAQRIL